MYSKNSRKFQIYLNRKIIDDPVLGQLSYDEYDSPDTCLFDKSKNICDLPFNDVEIQNTGNAFTCCPAWNPAMIGNVLVDDIRTIWQGKKAQLIRQTIIDGSYKYCNAKTCPAMLAGGGHRIVPKTDFIDPMRNIPKNISFSIDNTCNLICPSCRTEKIGILENSVHDTSIKIIRSVIRSLFNEQHDEDITLTIDGCGEIFFSSVYREIFETEEVFINPEKWPGFKIVMCTNGVMMTEKIQNKYKALFKKLLALRVSIDAGNKESYDIVREGGNWELLWENLDYFYATTISNPNIHWAWNLVLQADNIESIPALIKLAYNYPDKLPEIYIVNILNWGTYSQTEFDKKAVWEQSSEGYARAKEILSLPEVINYPKIFIPILN